MSDKNVKQVFMYPHRSQNDFLDLNKKALNKLGYNVQPTDVNFVRYLATKPKQGIVILNWVEDRVYGRSYKRVVQYFIKMIALVIFSKLFAKHVVWIKHNYRPHNSSGSIKRFKFICGLYSLLKIKPVSLEKYFSSPSLVHPLYKPDTELQKDLEIGDQKYTNDILFFGGIKPYKNLDLVLLNWPVSLSLTITRENKRRIALLPMSIAAKRKPGSIKLYSKPLKVFHDLKNYFDKKLILFFPRNVNFGFKITIPFFTVFINPIYYQVSIARPLKPLAIFYPICI